MVMFLLPVQHTPFVGRTHELTEIARLLAEPTCRLLSVVGLGGIGKTRLALEAATHQGGIFADGVFFVPLAFLHSPDLLASVIASALNVAFFGKESPDVQIVRYLREKHLLLILDNFEHLLESSGLLSAMLNATTAVKLLITSRERLNLEEEWVLTLDGLHYPDAQASEPPECFDAVQLFTHRARQIQSTFSMAANVRPIVAVCQRVEGMPLALELAVTWLRVMPCD